MDETDYLIINPIQIELLSGKINNEKKISVIEEMFYKKMEKLVK